MTGIERHLLDEAQLGVVVERERDEIDELVVVDVAHRDRVELERTKTGCRGRRDPGEHVVEPVAAREVAEPVAPQRVDRDVEPCRARRR